MHGGPGTNGSRTRHVDEAGATDRDELLTPDEAALRLKVTAEQVRSLIRKGELAAINIGAGKKRPLYRIRTDALEEFLHDRTHVPERTSLPRFKRLPPVADYFPDLH